VPATASNATIVRLGHVRGIFYPVAMGVAQPWVSQMIVDPLESGIKTFHSKAAIVMPRRHPDLKNARPEVSEGRAPR
jgi:hypothetical protein